ncbi:phosphoenolpyruvate synthase [Nonomuraea sp. NN258]|uniref:PEP/pyruvate-binding domain-containing protein n=1 Tax=Nonomuraea antri TaxID=2730852 RepID=UPI001569EBBC|nr:PEP/pyruvate-binding domain-containing protein [Nonomuraea antri]NRQ31011.1 phosphoenolpyruvate synthase [Nonomuraea antri]
MTTALDFSEIDGGMLAEVGGKAANLGELTRAGLPVPPGWALTTDAYRQAADQAGLAALIAAHTTPPSSLHGTPAPDGGNAFAAEARRRLLETPVPPQVREAVLKAYAALGDDVPVAVRSSATAEDLPFASFAGQQDTYLNVVGPDALIDAVRRCWASLWTDRAVAYRESNGIDHAVVRLAVVVQVMVDATAAGVMFTANPVTGTRREVVIDAAPGLGEAVVSGAVNPDRFIVGDGRIRERHAGDKLLSIHALPGGGTERRQANHDGLCLTDRQVLDLAALGARVEEHYGAPQDTEWAVDAEGRLWLTQARPITTLYPLPETTRPGLRVYFSLNVAQGVMGPLTPAGLSAFRLITAGAAGLFGHGPADPLDGAPFMAVSGQRVWFDITTAVRSRAGRAILPRALALGEARAVGIMRELFDDPRLSLIHTARRPVAAKVRRFLGRIHAPSRALQALTRPDRALARTRRLGAELDARLALPATATPAERLDHAIRMIHGTFPIIISIMPVAITGYALFALASRLSGVPIADMQDVLRSVPGNPTTEMDLRLWALAGRIEPEPFLSEPVTELTRRYQAGELPPGAQREIAAFLAEYGHRGVAEIDLGLPRWSENPAHLLGVLANYLRLDGGGDLAPDVLFAKGAVAAEAAIDRVAALAGRKGRLRAAVVRFALGRTRKLVGIRELPKFYAVKILAGVRRSLLVVGEHLVSAGVIESAHDVFFLGLDEARAALPGGGDLRGLVAERRAAYERESRRRHVPRVMLSDGTEPESRSTAAQEGALTGTAASAGTVTGPARVVLDPVGAHLEPGEILVCPSTDPGWTPLFLTAGGLVMEMGGAMSHGAVVAREYGIPAVVGVPDATHRVTTGQEITVNGAAGTVTVVEEGSSG